MNLSGYPNVLHNDKWQLLLSNIPTLDNMSNMKYFEHYVKSCTIPNYSMGEILSQLPKGMQVRHPLGGMKKNQELGQLVITFKMSEDMYNYMILFIWMQQLRHGQISPDHEGLFREYNIKRLTIQMLDNQKRPVADLVFTNAFLLDLGSLDLSYGTADEVTFTAAFAYEEIIYNIQSPMDGGVPIAPPVNITECGTSGIPITPDLDWEDNN